MKKKGEAVGKYLADLLRTIGTAMLLFSGFGLALDREEALTKLPETIAFAFVGILFVVAGALIVLLSTIEA